MGRYRLINRTFFVQQFFVIDQTMRKLNVTVSFNNAAAKNGNFSVAIIYSIPVRLGQDDGHTDHGWVERQVFSIIPIKATASTLAFRATQLMFGQGGVVIVSSSFCR